MQAEYLGGILDDVSDFESSGNEEEPEIANALQHSRTPGKMEGSLRRIAFKRSVQCRNANDSSLNVS